MFTNKYNQKKKRMYVKKIRMGWKIYNDIGYYDTTVTFLKQIHNYMGIPVKKGIFLCISVLKLVIHLKVPKKTVRIMFGWAVWREAH